MPMLRREQRPVGKELSMSFKSVFAAGAALLVSSTALLASVDGAALYKTKCAGCHGSNGEGKPAVKAPALKGTSWDANKIVEHVTKGEPQSKPPHNKGISGLTNEQAKAIAEYVETLK
jgi:mono/diheme cytochrome c family protein